MLITYTGHRAGFFCLRDMPWLITPQRTGSISYVYKLLISALAGMMHAQG
ncbi:protein of unknown function [Serratia sp. Tan611]|nr:protein of unknown function [Serratia sp. Tan611]